MYFCKPNSWLLNVSVTRNIRSILLTFLFAVILVYIFSIFGYVLFQGMSKSETLPCSVWYQKSNWSYSDGNVEFAHSQYSCIFKCQQFYVTTKLLIIEIIKYLSYSAIFCSLFSVFTIFYLILETMSTNGKIVVFLVIFDTCDVMYKLVLFSNVPLDSPDVYIFVGNAATLARFISIFTWI